MEMHQHHDFTFTGLENSVLNIGIHDVDHLASGRNESETVGVGLQVALGLTASENRPHGEIGETGNAFILSANQFVLLHQVGLLLNLKFLLPGTLTELRDLTECRCQALTIQTAKGHLAYEGSIRRIFLNKLECVLRTILAHGHARSIKINAQVSCGVGIWQHDILNGADVKRHGIAAYWQYHTLARHVNLDLVGQHIVRQVLGGFVRLELLCLLGLVVATFLFGQARQLSQSLFVFTRHQFDLLALALGRTFVYLGRHSVRSKAV
mmetsp:Transcript_31856/g.71490  ORF Transcript_31856/g.71490 Transcript_31856/m.71490 type:complete len:266 (+) Transcript_31856:943-1740(+)